MKRLSKKDVKEYKHLVLLSSLLNFILTPLHIAFLPVHSTIIVAVNFTFLILSGLLICQSKSKKYFYYVLGLLTLITIWLEFLDGEYMIFKTIRLLSSLVLFIFILTILIQELTRTNKFNLQSILGAISGYLFIGLVGGVLFELLNFLIPNFLVGIHLDLSYTYYYFSFISITTVGFGDITPNSPPSQAITILMSIVGQLYLTIVISLFVGKYVSNHLKDK